MFKLTLYFSLVLSLAGCHYLEQGVLPIPTHEDEQIVGKTDGNYLTIKKKFIDVKCLYCHKVASEKQSLRDKPKAKDLPFETEEEILNGETEEGLPLIVPGFPLRSAFYRALHPDPTVLGILDPMPPPEAIGGRIQHATTQELEAIEAWISTMPHADAK